ncbi:MAG: hypothetical protein E6X90_07980 [Veillonella sp.]|nr:hypothetical protein [Veillonella sp.]
MSSTTIIIIVAILFAVFMKFNKKRQAGEQQFVQENANKAILHIYGKSVKVDGKDLSTIDHKTGQYGQVIVALTPGEHTIESVYYTTDNVGTKTKNVETQPVTITIPTIPVQAGNEYNAAMYFYSAEQRNAYYKGDVDDAVLEVELELESGFTANTHAYIIVYRECK